MNNPIVYFKVSTAFGKKFFTPIKGQDKFLDQRFYKVVKFKPENVEEIYDFYNDYTKEYLNNVDTSKFYSSVNYTYRDGMFRFTTINEVNVVNYDEIVANVDGFEASEVYYSDQDSQEQKTNPVTTSLLSNIINKYPCPSIEESGFYYDSNVWTMLLRNITKHKNTMLTGPTGSGKTDIIMKVCERIGISCKVYDMGQMMDPITDLLGSHRLENGNSVFDYSRFVEDIQKPGVILLDELSRANPMANNILFPCLDGRRTLPVDIADSKSDRQVKVHPECVFIATANIGSEYSGTSELDLALENRFNIIQMDYLDKDIESKVLIKRTGISKMNAEKIVNVINSIRDSYYEGTISKTISTRESLECAELVADGFSLFNAIQFAILEKFNKRSEEYKIVKSQLMGY